jgi:hypothetical protein
MFAHTSRYYSLETAVYTLPDGRTVAYKQRRFLPEGGAMPLLVEIQVAQGDRLDLIASRNVGDPQQFWRVCDANNAINPLDLTSEPGRTLRIPMPQF